MRIVIVGCGKVGLTLAVKLREEGHEITVIDSNEKVIEQVSNTVDVIGYVGNGAVYSVLEEAAVRGADLLLAVTASDEINLLTCLVANRLSVQRTIARVRNPEYAENAALFHDSFGVAMTLNPERQLAQEIARILRFPSATRVELFARGRAELVSCHLPSGNPAVGLKLYELPQKLGVKVLVCAVQRGGEAIIPSGGFELEAEDELYMTGAPREVEKAFRKLGMLLNPIKNVLITGGGKVTYYLAQALSDRFRVKIIERNAARAQELAEALPNAVVLLGDAADHELLTEEGLKDADAFVAMTGLDEGNILSSMYAKQSGVSKVICKVNTDHLKALTRAAGIDSIVSSKNVTANTIVRVVRAYAAGASEEDNVRALYRIADDRAEMIEFAATADMTRLIGIPLKDLKLKKDILISCIVRKNRAIIPGGADVIEPNDRVLVCTAGQRLSELGGILEG
ncbi:MAG: Trk system potassium transporter TrkA [Clostridia bacterium]|nr:Trk system potassium transporter TrkA [Clostridia bacterium]